MIKNNEKAIQEAAYFIWQNAGCPMGQDEYFWAMAVEQINKNNSSCNSKKCSSSKSSCKSSVSKVSAAKKSASSAKSSTSKKSSKK